MGTPAYKHTLRIMGIDPGTDTLGCIIIDFNLKDDSLTLTHAETVAARNYIKQRQSLVATHGSRFARLIVLQEYIRAVVKVHHPHTVGVEKPYLGASPTTYAALSEAFFTIRSGIAQADTSITMHSFDPMRAKCAVGAAGFTEDVVKKRGRKVKRVKVHAKSTVREAVLKLVAEGTLKVIPSINVETLDEHSIDAIAVGMARIAEIRSALAGEPSS